MTDYLLEGLKKARADITGEIARCHATLQKLSTDLEHVDGVLARLAPDFIAESIMPKVFVPPKSWSKRGEMSRAVLSALRVAKGPLTAREIASMIVGQRGFGCNGKSCGDEKKPTLRPVHSCDRGFEYPGSFGSRYDFCA